LFTPLKRALRNDRLKIEQALNDAKEAIKASDIARMRTTKDALSAASQKLGEIIYKEAQAKAQAAQGAGAQQPGQEAGVGAQQTQEGSVVDAEVVDEKKDK
jgi:molecular chaperone DnaK